MVLGTYRPAELAAREPMLSARPVVREMQVHQQCVEIPLHDLTVPEVRSYLAARFAGADVPADLADRLHEHTDGTPLFVAAVADQLVARGLVVETDPGWSFVGGPGSLMTSACPMTSIA